MQVSAILQKLPASLEWMVLFNLSEIRNLVPDYNVVKAMFFLPADTTLDVYSHVILSSDGHFLAPDTGKELVFVRESNIVPYPLLSISNSLSVRFAEQLKCFLVDEADCLGLGEQAPYPPMILHLKVKSGYGEATALFHQAPSQTHYELLTAAGIQFLGGKRQG
ncbi:hypothetical protein ACFLXQ_04475, partial [Chloroflexota bacterium]